MSQHSQRPARIVLIATALTALVCLTAGMAWVITRPAVYTGQAQVTLSPRATPGGGITSADAVTLEASNALQRSTTTEPMLQAAAAADIPMQQLRAATSAVVIPGTTTIVFEVEDGSAGSAAAAANRLAELLVDDIGPDNPVATAEQTALASPTTQASGPATKVLAAIALLLSAAVTAAVFVVAVWVTRTLARGGIATRFGDWLAHRGPGHGLPEHELIDPDNVLR